MAKSSSKTTLTILLAVGLMAGSLARAQEEKKMQTHDKAGHALFTPADLKWAVGPASLPAGAQAAVLEGDPAKAGPFTLRLKIPADYKIPAHSHPADEHVTVISGTFHMGMGDKLDAANGKALPAGSFALMPAKTNHFAWASEETIVQLHGIGPWGINYVNPDDDPRKKPVN